MEKITIFTPTYNRAYILYKLYNSLKQQNNKEFIWMIVDDGSTDNTREIVEIWKNENIIPIEYYYKDNGGKQRAINYGLSKCYTELFCCVDSDDYLVENAIDKILNFWIKNQSTNISGIVSLRGKNNFEPLGTKMPQNKLVTKFNDLYEKYNFKGDTNLIYRTEILKKHPYPVAEGEKFISESYAYLEIDDDYNIILMDEITVICEYLEDGYTKNVYKLLKNNPKGYMKSKIQTAKHNKKIINKYLETIKYYSACKCLKYNGISKAPSKLLYIAAIIPGELVYYLYFKREKDY